MHCEIFTDSIYHGDQHLELDPREVAQAEERTVRLFLRGRHDVTKVTLQDGRKYLLRGHLAARIEAERRRAEKP
jgi:hypothetical protein